MSEKINGKEDGKTKIGLRNMLESCADVCGQGEICREMCCPYENDNSCHETILMNALDLIECLEAERDATLAKVPRWIRVGERLPEEKINPLTSNFEDIICACDFGGIPKRRDVRVYKFGCGHFLNGFQIMDGVVTHWMSKPELPELPKEV